MKDKKSRLIFRWASVSSVIIAFVALLVGSLGIVPRCDSFQTKVAAAAEHKQIRREIESDKTDNDQEHDQIYDQLKSQGDRIEQNHKEQQESIKDLQKTLWSIYREVKK